MASRQAISTALKLLSRAFAGVVDTTRLEVYGAALEDLTDEQVATATALVIKTHTGEFIPPPAVLRKAVAPAPLAIDGPAILCRIEKLAQYAPGSGMVYPPVAVVRAELGADVAYAYAMAGGPSMFGYDETGRSIAQREFQKALREATDRPLAILPVIGVESLPGATDERAAALLDDLAKQRDAKRLSAGGAR